MLVVLFALQSVSFAEEATLKYSYGSEAFNKHMLDLKNTTVYNGSKWVFEQGAFEFEGDFTMNGGNTGTVFECEVPEFRRQGVLPGQNLYLGRVLIRPSQNMDLYVFSGDRTTGKYILTDMQMNIRNYTLDITSVRDENGTFRLIDKVFLYAYEQNGTRKNYAASLYVSFENYKAAPADTSPENAVISNTSENETQAHENADGGKLELYAQMIAILEKENEDLLDQIALLQTQTSSKTQSDEAYEALEAELETCYSNIQQLTADNTALMAELKAASESKTQSDEAYEALKAELETCYSNIQQLTADNTALMADNTALVQQIKNAENTQETIEALNKVISDQEMKIESYSAMIAQYKADIEALKQESENARNMADAALVHPDDGKPMADIVVTALPETAYLTKNFEKDSEWIGWDVTFSIRNESDVPFTPQFATVVYYNGEKETTRAVLTYEEMRPHMGNDRLIKGNDPFEWGFGMTELENTHMTFTILGTDANGHPIEAKATAALLNEMKEDAAAEVQALRDALETCKAIVQEREKELESCYSNIESLTAENAQLTKQAENAESMTEEIEALNKVVSDQNMTIEGYSVMVDGLLSNLEALEAENRKGARLLTDPETEVSALGKPEKAQPVKEKAVQSEYASNAPESTGTLAEKETNAFKDNTQEEKSSDKELSSLNDDELNQLLLAVQKEIKRREPQKEASPASDFVYASNGQEVQINGYQGSQTEVVIPSSIDGLPVTRIANYAMESLDQLTSVALPSTLTDIGSMAFAWNDNLTGILEIPSSVISVGQSAFHSTGFTGIILNSDAKIGGNGALGSPNAKFLFIREGANPRLDAGALNICFGLEKVIVPSSVTSLPKGLLQNSSKATVITPEGSAAEAWAKENFIPVDTASYDALSAQYEAMYLRSYEMDEYVIREKTGAEDKTSLPEDTEKIHALNERIAQLEEEIAALNMQIAEKDTAIAQMSAKLEEAKAAHEEKGNAVSDEKTDYTAYSLEALSGVLTEVREEIESRAPVSEKTPYDDFVYASNGKEISIRGYRGTDTEVVIPDEIDDLPVTMIGSSAFENNGNIVKVHIPDTVREIGFSAFYNCRKLKTVNIPENLEILGGAAFGYTALEGVLVFPETTKEIGSGSFINCSLTGIVILGDCVIEDGNTISNIKPMEFIYVHSGAHVSIEGAIDRLPNLTKIVLPDTAVLAMDESDSPFWSCPMLTIYTPEGSKVHKKAMEFMLPVNTADFEKWDAYYDSLY